MPVTINGSTGLTFPDNATQSTSPKTGFVNRIINGGFGINQRGVSGTVTLAAGVYGHDRWKAGASGCTYTFATVANVTTLTITAGSLIQVIEGINLQSGTFTLSFTGTAQGKIGAGSFGASGITGAAVGGTNLNIEINTGTVSLVQFELGLTATAFDFRSIGTELALCQRYYFRFFPNAVGKILTISGTSTNSTQCQAVGVFPVPMRIAPTALEQSGTAGNYSVLEVGLTLTVCSAVPAFIGDQTTTLTFGVLGTVSGGLITSRFALLVANATTGANAFLGWSAEL